MQIRQEQRNAEEAIKIVKQILSGGVQENSYNLKRKDVSNLLDISMDTLQNWEMNGLLTVKRKNNGYRVYTDEDIQRLKIIRSLRCANYSLEAILRLLQQLSKNPNTDIRAALNIPKQTEDIISVCDRLIISLSEAETNAKSLLEMLQKRYYYANCNQSRTVVKKLWQSACSRQHQSIRKIRHHLRSAWRKWCRKKYND